MAFRRCPDCGAEWWNEETCLDCGATLQDIPDGTSDDASPAVPDDLADLTIDVSSDAEPPRLARFLAFFVDYLLISLVAVALGAFTSETHVRFDGGRKISERTSPTWALAFYGAFILVYATVTVAKWQRTPGMMATGVAVERVTADGGGRRLTWLEAVVRAVVAMGWFAIPPLIPADTLDGALSSVLSWTFFLWPVLVFAPILVDPQRRGLHDLLLRTRVVRRVPPQWARNLPGMSPGRRTRRTAD